MNNNAELANKKLGNWRWWKWLILPWVVIFIVPPVLLAFAVIVPIGMVQNWRFERRKARRLRADGRQVEWSDAVDQFATNGRQLIAEIGPKGVCAVWLVKIPSSELDYFASLPSYASFESHPRDAWTACERIDSSSSSRLISYMKEAKRVENSVSQLAQLPDGLKDSIKIVTVWNELSPSMLLQEMLR